jgi:hypothetical protein
MYIHTYMRLFYYCTPLPCLSSIFAISFAIQLKFLYILSLLIILTILFLFPLLDFLAYFPQTFIALQHNNFFQFLRCFVVIICLLPCFLYLTCVTYTFLHISSRLKWSWLKRLPLILFIVFTVVWSDIQCTMYSEPDESSPYHPILFI